MTDYAVIIPLLASFLVTLFFLPTWIKRAGRAGLVGKDVHKLSSNNVAEAGGVTVIAGFVIGLLVYIALKIFRFNSSENVIELFALMSVVLITAFIGMIDDILGWKIGLSKRVRIFLVLFAAVPLMAINAGESFFTLPILGRVSIGLFYTLIFIPIGVVGASTTFNFIAGYNGLEARQGILILLALALASWLTGGKWLSMVSLCMIFALLAFLLFNYYPAKVFPGDAMTYSLGALIAAVAILGNLERFAVFIFIPYIIETILKLRGRLKIESFALLQKDGSLDLKNKKIYSLTHFAILVMKKYKNKVFEKDVVLFINSIQILLIIAAFLIFRKGISV